MNSAIKEDASTKKAASGLAQTVATKRGCLLGLAVGDALGQSIESFFRFHLDRFSASGQPSKPEPRLVPIACRLVV